MKKPKFVVDVENHTGMECRFLSERRSGFTEWELLSPTGITILVLGGMGEELGSLGHVSRMSELQGK